MNEPLTFALSGLVGTLLGLCFFGGLWFTVQKSMASPRPALWLVTSLLLRMSLALAGLYFVAGGQLARLLCGVAGFVSARLLVTWWTRPLQVRHAA